MLYDDNREAEAELFRSLRAHPDILEMLAQSPWMTDCRNHAQEILDNPELFSAMLIYLRDAQLPVPAYARRLLRLGRAEWPVLDWQWLGIVLAAQLTKLPVALLARLKAAGALHNDRLTLPPPRFLNRVELLHVDKARLAATVEIHRLERENRRDGLRMAILMDKIGHVALKLDHDPQEYNAGAVFRALHLAEPRGDLALLTGQIICLPRALCYDLSGREVPGLPGYALIGGPEFSKAVVRVNAAFSTGAVRVIVGTQAFLGQGWDAPAMNSLILGTNLARFVAVNQLRGRALRIERNIPEKTSNIWHLAIVPGDTLEGEDIARLHRRFDCFARLDRNAGQIQSYFSPKGDVQQHNAITAEMARRHDTLAADWQSALHLQQRPEPRLFRETSIGSRMRRQMVPVSSLSWLGRLREMFGQGPSDQETRRSLERIARLAVEALRELGDFSALQEPRPEVHDGPAGYQISLHQTTRFEESLFHDTLRQILDPVGNPRYIIVVRSGLFLKRFQYFAVPGRFDGNRARAEIFWRNWQGIIGQGELIYTRTPVGRGELQAARLNSHARRVTHHLNWR